MVYVQQISRPLVISRSFSPEMMSLAGRGAILMTPEQALDLLNIPADIDFVWVDRKVGPEVESAIKDNFRNYRIKPMVSLDQSGLFSRLDVAMPGHTREITTEKDGQKLTLAEFILANTDRGMLDDTRKAKREREYIHRLLRENEYAVPNLENFGALFRRTLANSGVHVVKGPHKAITIK